MEIVDPIIEIEVFEGLLEKKVRNVRIVDACYFPPKDPRNPELEHNKESIPKYLLCF